MNHRNTPLYSSRPAEIELIRSMAQGTLTAKQKKQLNDERDAPADSREAFIIRTAADWLRPGTQSYSPDKLFGDFWYRGELCILFADTNAGKSILAVQIGNALSSGEPLPVLGATLPPEKVLYFDFELSAEQFEGRYSSHMHGHYKFHSNFYRVVLNPGASGMQRFKNYAEYMNNALENIIITTNARTLILDNITCLRSGTQAAESAITLMRNLQAIKNKYGLSVLVLAHTPKRDTAKPITRNDLQGSKMLINFADSAFALGESQAVPGLRYLKQIKQRSGKEHYGTANICLCRITKPANFLQFEFEDFGDEADHLRHYKEQQLRHTEEKVERLHRQGVSIRAIAAQTGLSKTTVGRLVKRVGREREEEI